MIHHSINFVCPDCKEKATIDEMIETIITCPARNVVNGYIEPEHPLEDMQFLETDRYCCSNCGYNITDDDGSLITDEFGLLEYLENNNFLTEEVA